MDKSEAASESLWKVALVVIAVALPFLVEKMLGPLDVHGSDLLKNLLFGTGGVGFAVALAIAFRLLQHFIAERLASKPPREAATRQY